MRRAYSIAAVLLAASCSEPASLVTVTEARVIATNSSAAAYFTLTNSGGSDRLLAVDALGAGNVSLHETSMEGGVMRMRAVDGGIAVGQGDTVKFTPYGRHAMIELDRPLDSTRPLKLRFQFERQGVVTVEAPVSGPLEGAN